MTRAQQLLRVLRHRDFRLLWLANSASVVGDRIVTVALALFVIDLTGSATDLGFVLAAYSLPLVGFLLVGGVFADRLPRHLVVVVTDLVRFVLHGLLALLIVTMAERIPPDKLSRVTSYDWALSFGLMPLGFVLAGPAADALGATKMLLGGAAIAFVVLAIGLLPRQTRMLERRDDEMAVAVPLADGHPRVPAA
jgi:hypothetical protein